MKTKKRITHIAKYYQAQENIWDLCCDHGKIGEEIHRLNPRAHVYFVDQISSIIENLKTKHIRSDIPGSNHFFYLTKDCKKLKISTSNNYIIIAGIGGILALDILRNLKNQDLKQSKILVSPHNNYFWLRNEMKSWTGLGITQESFIYESGHFYEMFELSFKNCPENPLIPHYYSQNSNNQQIIQLALKHYNYYKKALGDPLRPKMLDFFEMFYSGIIKQ